MRLFGHGALAPAARFLLALYLRDLSVLGAGRVPSEGPLLLVGRARDPLIGRLLLLAAAPRPVRMLADAHRFRRAVWSSLLRSAGFIQGASKLTPDGRRELLARCEHAVVGGHALALFIGEDPGAPEELAAEVCAAVLQRGLPLAVVPFSWRGLPAYPRRGKARLVFGPPFRMEARGLPEGPDPAPAVRGVLLEETERLDPRDATWEEMDWLERARPLAEGLLQERGGGPPPEGAPAGSFLQRYQWARLSLPLKLRAAVRSARACFALCDTLGVRLPAEQTGAVAVSDRTYVNLLLAAGGCAVAFYGWLFLALPFWAATWLGREWAAERTKPPGPAVLGALCFAAPLVVAFQAWLLWEVYGRGAALFLCAAALPACAWAILYGRVRKGALGALLALLRYRLPGRLPLALELRKARLRSALEPLLWMYQ